MRLYIITKRTLFSIGFCLLIGVIAGGIALTSTVQAIQTASAQREIPIYCVDTDKKQVALSFDAAWGNEQTEHLLDILDKYNVKLHFPCRRLGRKISRVCKRDFKAWSRCRQSQQYASTYDADVG